MKCQPQNEGARVGKMEVGEMTYTQSPLIGRLDEPLPKEQNEQERTRKDFGLAKNL